MKLYQIRIFSFALLFLSSIGLQANQSELVAAIVVDDKDKFELLLEQNVDVNAVEKDGSLPLLWAVYYENEMMVADLIQAGADVDAVNREGMNPLLMSAMSGNAAVAKLLLKGGAKSNLAMSNGETPLMMAARNGDLETIKVFLDAGANVNATESLRGTNALMWAVANRNAAATKLLLQHDADMEMRSAATKPGRGPYLAPSARSRIKEFYFGTGAGGNTLSEEEKSKVDAEFSLTREEILQYFPKDLAAELEADKLVADKLKEEKEAAGNKEESKQWGGLSALHFAIREKDFESIKVLLEAGANVNAQSEFGWTPLLIATQNRFYKIGKFLLERGANPNIANEGGWNPLYIATDNRNIEGGDYPTRKPDMDHLEYIRLLIDAKANPNLKMTSSTETRTIFTHQWLNESGATPFLRAAQSSDLELMRLLLDHGADPNVSTDIGITPLMVASGIGWVEGVTYEWSEIDNVEVVKLLLELGNNPNAQESQDYRTALMGAAHKGRDEVVKLLVDAGAKLETRDIGSRDSLHKLSGVRWQAVDYANGLVRVGVQSPTPHPQTEKLLWTIMKDRGLDVPVLGRRLDSISLLDD